MQKTVQNSAMQKTVQNLFCWNVCVESVLLLSCQRQDWFICLVIWIFTKLVPTDDENTMTFSNCKKPQTWRSSNHKYWLKVISKKFFYLLTPMQKGGGGLLCFGEWVLTFWVTQIGWQFLSIYTLFTLIPSEFADIVITSDNFQI